jgi:hypothetical protein
MNIPSSPSLVRRQDVRAEPLGKPVGPPPARTSLRATCLLAVGFRLRPAGSIRRSGMALVVTLGMVVLLTFLIVAFFSATTAYRTIENTSAGGVTARILAEGAAGAVRAELIQEIIAGSTATTVGTGKIFYPTNSAGMIPIRAVASSITATDANFANLVKQSGQPFYSGATIFGASSSDSSTAAAANGRRVGAGRWDAPMLTGATFATNQTPNWIYITPGGYANAMSSDVIGRVAFNVYDVGGLLNANASGFAPRGGGGDPSEMPAKGSAVWADLRALPGINPSAYAANDAWPPKWRITGDWASFTSNPSGTSSLMYYLQTGWRTAFLQPGGTASDRMFASRQDLIRYAKANPATFTANGNLLTALQYLTTFSLDRERPTFRPAPGRPTVAADLAAGGNDARGLDDQINPPLASQTKAGGSLAIKNRFPLSRLELVATPVPPSGPAGSASDILEYFGLTWDASNNRWNYNHGSATSILRLSQVPAGRDPDFFELLKAALTVGGLGKQFGFNFPSAYSVALPSSRLGGDDGRIEDQVVQIAANIIDQADPDSYPTRIHFNGRTFYGIEDLPRIYRGHETSYNVGQMPNFGVRDGSGPITWPAFLYVTMVYPELWNPHRPSPSPAGPTPANFRVVARTFAPVGAHANTLWDETGTKLLGGFFNDFRIRLNGPDCRARINYTSGEGSASSAANAAITFNLGSGDAGFREPRPLSAVGYPAGSNANGSPNVPDMALDALAAPGLPDTVVRIAESAVPPPLHGGNNTTYRDALGFVTSYLPMADAGGLGRWLNLMQGLGGPVALELQYQEGAQWWTIDKMDVSYASGANSDRLFHIQSLVANRADPRTSRWGSLYSIPDGFGDPFIRPATPTPYRYDTGYTANPTSGNFPVSLGRTVSQAPGWTGAIAGGLLGYLQENLSSSPLRYTDPDGILRGADARYSSGDVGRPMSTGNTDSRPVVLNRPFRSVAELGNVFRDTPWRNLDFMSPESADRALLDVFTVSEIPDDGIVAGRVNLNSRQTPVIAALIQNAGLATGANISAAEATAAASKLTDWTASSDANQGPLSDRSELVGRFVSGTSFSGPLEEMANELAAANRPIKASREAITKALADAGTTRTWNFLIDVIAQSGQASPTGEFVPHGEFRLWNSVAIDRFSAEILGQSTEIIQE